MPPLPFATPSESRHGKPDSRRVISQGKSPARCLYSRSPLLFFSLSANAAALILATWIAADPPEVVMQSRPGIDIQVGHNTLIGLVRRDSGMSSFDLGIYLGRVVVETAIKLQFTAGDSNGRCVNRDNRAFLERLIIVEPVFHIYDRPKTDRDLPALD